MTITGTVVYEELEGGFWGIVGDDDQKYRPNADLPQAVKKHGQRITAEIEPVQAFTFSMWGRNVQVASIAAL